MNQWRMRTTLMVSLLAVSLGLTAMCLIIIRFSVGQEIQRGLDADITHSLNTFRNIADQRNLMLAREAGLLADLPSLKALMATQDQRTIQDVECPAFFEPVALIETGNQGANDGTTEEAYA